MLTDFFTRSEDQRPLDSRNVIQTIHPPGGATALIAVIGSAKIKSLGYLYVLSPVLTGSLILLLVALIFNNMTNHRKYPNDKRVSESIKNVIKRIKVN